MTATSQPGACSNLTWAGYGLSRLYAAGASTKPATQYQSKAENMEFPDLTTDTSYLQACAADFFDYSPWETTTNPFERRMAMNLTEGTVIESIDIATLGRVLGTATKLRRQAITVDLTCSADVDGRMSATVVGIFSYYVAPTAVDSACNFALALSEVPKSRKCFFVSVTPENKFWVHSEQALASGEQDWAENLRSSHTLVSF